MESNLILIIGLGIVSFLMLYLSFNLDSKDKGQRALKTFSICFVIFLLVLVPKAVMDYKDTCEITVQNETTTANQTFYTYNQTCITNTHTTPTIFMTSYLWYIGIFGIFMLIYVVYEVFSFLTRIGKLGDRMIKSRKR